MLKVLLADDNILTLNQLNEIFLQLAGRAVVVGQAMNGRQAAELALKEKPDLVIMDVEMPVINGIEAARQITAALPAVKILALSNYDSFQYLRGMMQAGAMDYLLKHELSLPLISKRLRDLEQLCVQEKESAIREQYFSLIAKQSFLTSLVSGVEQDPVYAKIMLRQREFSGQKSALCILHITNFLPLYQAGRQEKLIQSVLNICSSVFSAIENGLIAPVLKEEFVALFNFDNAVSQKKAQSQLEEYQALIKGNLKRLLNLDVLMGGCFLYGSVGNLSASYQKLGEELGRKPFQQPEAAEDRLDILEEKALIDALDQRDLAQTERVLGRIFAPLKDHAASGQAAQNLTEDLLSLLDRYLKRQNLLYESGLLQRLRLELSSDWSPSRVYEAVTRLFETVLGSSIDRRFSSYSPHTQRAMILMRKRCMENISLSDISAQIGLSAAYLSKIFKAETGCTLIDYLTELRLSRAKTLLNNSHLSIREISERAGFGSSTYFIKVFRTQTGETPVQYQERHRRQTENGG